ncbi:MAG: PAS domain S-box protein [Nitrospira sp.]|nr:PAS domain S-box protein [Nitrospira sp.]
MNREQLVQRIAGLNRFSVLTFGIIVVTFSIDCISPMGFAVWGLYLPAIVGSSFSWGKKGIVMTTVALLGLILVGAWMSPPGGDLTYGMMNRLIGMVTVSMVGWLCVRLIEKKQKLWSTEQRLANILESTNEGICGLDNEGRGIFVNAAASRMLGYRPDEIIGKNVHDLMHRSYLDSEPSPQGECQVCASVRSGQDCVVESAVFRRKDGSVIPVAFSSAPIREENIEAGAVLAFQDITDRKQAEVALRQSESRYRALVVYAKDVIYRADSQGRFTFFNPMAVELTGYADRELIGLRFVEIIHAEYRAFVSRFYLRQFVEQTCNTYLEFPIVRKDGREVWVGQNVQVLVEEGQVIGFQAIVHDLTERRRTEEVLRNLNATLERRVQERTAALRMAYNALRQESLDREAMEHQFRQAQKLEAVGQLAGGLAHDFNNSLTAIVGFGQLIKMGLSPDHPLARYADQILHACDSSSTLTKRLLTFSRQQAYDPKAVDLNTVITAFTGLLPHSLQESLDIDICLCPEPAIALIDASQFEQALLNLVLNARDAMPDGGRLVLSIGRAVVEQLLHTVTGPLQPGAYVTVSVRDTGCGMDNDMLSHMFEPFFTTKGRGKGTGLGLPMVHGTVVKAEGGIDVQSRIGAGTTVTIYLPEQSILDKQDVKPDVSDGKQGEAGGETILVVEDDSLVRNMTRDFLAGSGYTVVEAEDGAAGYEICANPNQRIDLLLTDMMMPKMNGRELAEQAKLQRPEIPIILMSGYTDDPMIAEAIAMHAVEFLAKPFLPADLLKRVRSLLDGRLCR